MRRLNSLHLTRVGNTLLKGSFNYKNNSTSTNNNNNNNIRQSVELPDPPYALPSSSRFNTERSGAFNKNWLNQLPLYKPQVRNSVYLPSKEELWNSPIHEGLEIIIERLPYHDALRYIMEHNYFFLFTTILKARDAPLPHVMYEDFMKCRTFSSLQNPPEEQFALSPELLRALLCISAYHCILDPHYFTTCQILFQKIEQQQTLTFEVLSAWVYCCTASGKVDEALTYAKHMSKYNIPFDEIVFSLMQHPSINPLAIEYRAISHSAKGLLLQRRLSGRLQIIYKSDGVAAHGMFVFYALTLNHIKKWEVIRAAASLGIILPERTLSLAVEVFAKEKGLRCGPKTIKAFTIFLARDGAVGHLLYVLLRARKNELLPEFQGLPHTSFSEKEEELILNYVNKRGKRDGGFAAAMPLIQALIQEDNPSELFHSLTSHTLLKSSNNNLSNKEEEGEEKGLTTVMTPVHNILREINILDKAARVDVSHNKNLKNENLNLTQIEIQEELQELYKSNTPSGIREMAQMHIIEEKEWVNRVERLQTAWVNPDNNSMI